MYESDLPLLRCPTSGTALRLEEGSRRAADGEILEGTLSAGAHRYPIRNGIPRFVEDVSGNASWDFKWRVLDGGRGLNYRIIDRNDPAYSIHDIYDRNGHEGRAFRHMQGKLVLDLGCGVGQYAVKSLLEQGAGKVVAVDLTGGVDVFRGVVEQRYPQLRDRLLIVQANVFALPFAAASFDYVYSLGVLMHTGRTLEALDRACALVKNGGEINVWIYASDALAYDATEADRGAALHLFNVDEFLRRQRPPMQWIHRFRRMSHAHAVRIVSFFSSDFMYRLVRRPRFQWIARHFPTVDHPDRDYRMINNYDGYINNWCDTWSEHELFPVFRRHSIALLGLSTWRLGMWGRKVDGFYPGSDPS
jgi:SAM-dependent methyltransferase